MRAVTSAMLTVPSRLQSATGLLMVLLWGFAWAPASFLFAALATVAPVPLQPLKRDRRALGAVTS